MIQRSTDELRLVHAERCDEAALPPTIIRQVAPGTRIHSDEWAAYRNLNQAGRNYDHRTVNHQVRNMKSIYGVCKNSTIVLIMPKILKLYV